MGAKNPIWAGDKVSYEALHGWVKRHKKKPARCQLCNKKKRLDLANISQKYIRDLNDWEWLCRLCHMTKDGRLESLVSLQKSKRKFFPEKKVPCGICGKLFNRKQEVVRNCSLSCARQESKRNRKRGKSGLLGVYPSGSRWRSTIQENGKWKHIGTFKTKEEAALAYNLVANEIYKKEALLNEV